MTHVRTLLYKRQHLLAVTAIVLVLGGVVLLWLRVETAEDETSSLASEADRRGEAVSTLAEDVRTLRQQITDDGGTPAAPDPAKAVRGLPQRIEVPVVGPSGPPGPQGPSGKPAPTITPEPGEDGEDGKDGAPGEPGADSTVPGPTGPPGRDGVDGTDGADGQDGRDGEDGQPPVAWTFTYGGFTYTCSRAAPFDPQAPQYECDSNEPQPSPTDDQGILGLDPLRRRP